MSGLTGGRWVKRLVFGACALSGLGVVSLSPAPAGARGLLDATVTAYVPAPYSPHTAAGYGYSRYDDYPYYAGGPSGTSGHPWQ
jgi:hypothetical protein